MVESGGSSTSPMRTRAGTPTNSTSAPSISSIAKWRAWTKRQVTSIRWEMGMLVFVIVYFVIVFVTFALDDQKVGQLVR